VRRLDQTPNAFGLTLGGGFGGPQRKDLFIYIDTTAPFPVNPQYAPLFDTAFHEVRPADFSDNIDSPANIVLTQHDHDLNWNGDNDGFNAAGDRQKALHVRDDRNLPPNVGGNVQPNMQLPGTVRAWAQSFRVDDLDIVLNNTILAGPPPEGLPAADLNDRTVFHESGHKMSLRHNLGTMSVGAAAFPNQAVPLQAADNFDLDGDGIADANGSDVDGDGVPDAAWRVDVASYLGNAGVTRYGLGNPTREIGEGVTRTGYMTLPAGGNRNYLGYAFRVASAANPQEVWAVVFSGNQVNWPGDPNGVRGTIFGPETLDWTPYLATNGPTLQRNLNVFQMDDQGNPLGGAPGPAHAREVRLRTNP